MHVVIWIPIVYGHLVIETSTVLCWALLCALGHVKVDSILYNAHT